MNNYDKAKSMLITELKGLGIIDGDESMIWKSPDNDFTFKINRVEIGDFSPYNTNPRYMNTIEVLNDIGIKILELRFSEIDAVRILDNFQEFVSGDYSNVGDSIIIPISTTNTTLNSYSILLENIFDFEDRSMRADNYDPYEVYDNLVNDQFENGCNKYNMRQEDRFSYREILLKIQQYNPIENKIVNRVSMRLSMDDIESFAYALFFISIIDIEFTDEYKEVLDRIDTFVTVGKLERPTTDYNINCITGVNENFMNPPIERYPMEVPAPDYIPENCYVLEEKPVTTQNSAPKRISLDAHNKGVIT